MNHDPEYCGICQGSDNPPESVEYFETSHCQTAAAYFRWRPGDPVYPARELVDA